jgi:hypothetical protein
MCVCPRRSTTPPHVSQLRQSAPVTSPGERKPICVTCSGRTHLRKFAPSRQAWDALHNIRVTVDISPSTVNLAYFVMCALIALALVRLFGK